jgi:hypothetical protein
VLISCGFIYTVLADWKPSAIVYTHENLDRAFVEWQNMAICKYKNAEITKNQDLR